MHLNIFCLICINLYYTLNYAKFAKSVDFTQEPKQTVSITVITYAAGTKIIARHSQFVLRWLPVSEGHGAATHRSRATLLLTYTPMCQSSLNRKTDLYNSLDLNTVDYSVSRALQQIVYHHKISEFVVVRLDSLLIDCWTQLSQDTDWWMDGQLPNTHYHYFIKGLNFVWANFVSRWSRLLLSLYIQVKNWVKSMHFLSTLT